jgi:hypothetical protein
VVVEPPWLIWPPLLPVGVGVVLGPRVVDELAASSLVVEELWGTAELGSNTLDGLAGSLEDVLVVELEPSSAGATLDGSFTTLEEELGGGAGGAEDVLDSIDVASWYTNSV